MARFSVTSENHDEVRDFLLKMAQDGARLSAALAQGVTVEDARRTLKAAQTTAQLNAWIAARLSRDGRERMLSALRQRRRAQKTDFYHWRLDQRLMGRVKEAADRAGLAPEAWLETVTATTSRRSA